MKRTHDEIAAAEKGHTKKKPKRPKVDPAPPPPPPVVIVVDEDAKKKARPRRKDENGLVRLNRRSNVEVSRVVQRAADTGPILDLDPTTRHGVIYPALDLQSLGRLARTCRAFRLDLSTKTVVHTGCIWIPTEWRQLITGSKMNPYVSYWKRYALRTFIHQCILPSGYFGALHKETHKTMEWTVCSYELSGGYHLYLRDVNNIFAGEAMDKVSFKVNDNGVILTWYADPTLAPREALRACAAHLRNVVQHYETFKQDAQWLREANTAYECSVLRPRRERFESLVREFNAIRGRLAARFETRFVNGPHSTAPLSEVDQLTATLLSSITTEMAAWRNDLETHQRLAASETASATKDEAAPWILDYMHRKHPESAYAKSHPREAINKNK